MDITFGYAIYDRPLEEQANQQGFTLGKQAEQFEKIRKSINMCGFHVATGSQVDSMFKKLHKKVVKKLKEIDKDE